VVRFIQENHQAISFLVDICAIAGLMLIVLLIGIKTGSDE
jgi:hypothetical protein